MTGLRLRKGLILRSRKKKSTKRSNKHDIGLLYWKAPGSEVIPVDVYKMVGKKPAVGRQGDILDLDELGAPATRIQKCDKRQCLKAKREPHGNPL
ncbi:hypothetical protein ElyMa_004376100 [Elysia marginata]|uniref:PiggyBac transposable element-derived protein domain-containing protein n=1 Tax=Elysia marginata TaxID=1093978 RepID=A0AAV4H5H6_9GAST|nr:hypothetical protein ElyMa_004376100 [Elysia marginata]